jgi:hypothetical protein
MISVVSFDTPSLWEKTEHTIAIPQILKKYEPQGYEKFIQRLSYSRQQMIFDTTPFL